MKVKISPSVLSADLGDLNGAVDSAVRGGADLLHVDVMDGHFVPNLTFGIPVVEALARRAELPLDVHLMVANPERLLDSYLEAGASLLSVHWEATTHLQRVLARVREHGARAGVALNPATPVECLVDILDDLDFVLLMSVNPGFSGQKLIPSVLRKALRLTEIVAERGAGIEIEMDGGIGPANISEVVSSGVHICVSGSEVFGQPDPAAAIRRLRAAAGARK